jgi:hypothetical protein
VLCTSGDTYLFFVAGERILVGLDYGDILRARSDRTDTDQ